MREPQLFLNKKEYNLKNLLENDLDVLMALQFQTATHTSFENRINKESDFYIPYLIENLSKELPLIHDYVDKGLMNSDLTVKDGIKKIIREGYYTYYKEVVKQNEDVLLYNHAVQFINDKIGEQYDIGVIKPSDIDFKLFEDTIEVTMNNYDLTNSPHEVQEISQKYFDDLYNKRYFRN